jgi:phosphocarrier protein HPr
MVHLFRMKDITITIINKLGLHARASAKFVSTASRFQSRIDVTKDNKTINGKSIMGVMMLAAHTGTELRLQFDGPDEEGMCEAMLQLINNRFGEAE